MNARTPVVLTEQDTLDRMARNRASDRRPAKRAPAEMPPIPAEAFRLATLTQAVHDAKAAVAKADCAKRITTSKVLRERARRVKMKAQRALADAERALQAEKRGEMLADAVQRTSHVQAGAGPDGEDVMLREARVVVRDGKRAEVVTALDYLLTRKSIDAVAHAGGLRYRAAYEAAGVDLYPIGMGGDGGGGRSAPGSGNHRIENAVAQSRDLQRMRAMVDADALAVVDAVVIDGRDVRGWAASRVTAKRTGMDPAIAMGLLKATLGMFARMK